VSEGIYHVCERGGSNVVRYISVVHGQSPRSFGFAPYTNRDNVQKSAIQPIITLRFMPVDVGQYLSETRFLSEEKSGFRISSPFILGCDVQYVLSSGLCSVSSSEN